MRFFRYDSGFWSITARVFDLMTLNLLWFVTSLPFLTLGAASAALSDVSMRMARGEEPPILKSYFSAFIKNWKRASMAWLLCLPTVCWLILGLAVCAGLRSPLLRLTVIPEGCLLILCVLTMPYVFPVCAEEAGGVIAALKSALYLALLYLPWSCLLVLTAAVPLAVTLLVPKAFPVMLMLWIFLGAGGIAYARAHILKRLFARKNRLAAK